MKAAMHADTKEGISSNHKVVIAGFGMFPVAVGKNLHSRQITFHLWLTD